MTRPLFQSIQLLRGIAALMVVLFHLQIVEGKYGAGALLLPALLGHADSGVDLFFVLSGFVMVTIAAGSYGSPREAGRFLLRRGWRILPLYWFYTSIVVVLMVVAPGMANSSYRDQSVLASYLLWPQAQLPLLTVGWTLVHETFFYLVMAVAIAFARDRQLPWLLAGWAAATLATHAWPPGGNTPWGALVSSPLSLEFIAGALVGLYWHRLPAALAMPTMTLGVLSFAGSLLWLADTPPQALPVLHRVAYFGLPGTLLVLGAVCWEQARQPRLPRLLLSIGDSSYSLYLSHVFVISALGRLWQRSGFAITPWQHALFLTVAVAACLAAGWLSWLLMEQPLQRMARTDFRHKSATASQRA